jgi:hypothetical protein
VDLTEPAIHPRFCDAIGKVSDDLAEALTLAGVDSQHRAADAGVLVLAGAFVGLAAVTEFELARLKVSLHEARRHAAAAVPLHDVAGASTILISELSA